MVFDIRKLDTVDGRQLVINQISSLLVPHNLRILNDVMSSRENIVQVLQNEIYRLRDENHFIRVYVQTTIADLQTTIADLQRRLTKLEQKK